MMVVAPKGTLQVWSEVPDRLDTLTVHASMKARAGTAAESNSASPRVSPNPIDLTLIAASFPGLGGSLPEHESQHEAYEPWQPDDAGLHGLPFPLALCPSRPSCLARPLAAFLGRQPGRGNFAAQGPALPAAKPPEGDGV